MTLQELITHFEVSRRISDTSYQCKCPVHADSQASLTISQKDGKLLLHCHAGCSTSDILAEIGLSFADINPEKERQAHTWKEKLEYGQKKQIEAVYDYEAADGKYLYSKVRFEGKKIRYITIDYKNDTYQYHKKSELATLYRLPELIRAVKNGYPVYIVEGEKDADTLKKLGYTATTAGGVNDWKKEYAKYFIGAKVVILPDNDESGMELKDRLLKDLKHFAHSIRWTVTSTAAKGDVTDYLEKEGRTKDDLKRLVSEAGNIGAPWLYYTGKDQSILKINADILADSISRGLHYLIVRRPDDDKDDFYIYEEGVYNKCNRNAVKGMIRRYIPVGLASDGLINNTCNLLFCKEDNICKYQDLDIDEWKINLRNGLYNLKTRQLEPHTPNLYSTIQFDCEYHPEKQVCPVFTKYMNDLCTDEEGNVDREKMAVIQEFGGIILSNVRVSRTKISLVLYSLLGNTGKTQLLNLIRAFLGDDRIANVPIQDMNETSKFALGSIVGKRLISIGDQTGSDINDSAIFKQLTGGDPVKVEQKGKQPLFLAFTGAIIISCNNLPNFRDDKGGHMFERLCIVPCTNTIPKELRDNALLDKMIPEKDAIFSWFLEGLQRLIRNNFRLTESKACREAGEDYRCMLDTVHRYLKEVYITTDNKMDMVPKVEFENGYTAYCMEEQFRAVNKRNIKDRMEKNGIPVIMNAKGIRCYRYLKRKDEEFQSITEKNMTPEQMKIIFGN